MQLPAQGEANKSTTNTLTFLLCYATLICVIRTPAEVENAPLMLLASCGTKLQLAMAPSGISLQ